jgi:ppGpp synthetase/RelA/SpoT-type nucleotidyltranferase
VGIEEAAAEAARAYAAARPELVRITGLFIDFVTELLDDAGINYVSVTGRTKSVESYAAKAARTVDTPDGPVPLYSDPATQITDQIGVRVVTYLRGDVTAVAEVLADQFSVFDDRDMGQETARQGRFGYASRHLLVAPDPVKELPAAYTDLKGRTASVQLRTILQHAWAEFEHDVRYKGSVPQEHAPDLDRRFTLAAGLLELADREFTEIRDRLQASMEGQQVHSEEGDPRISAADLATFLAGQFQGARWSRTDHYAWISGLLLELGITSLDELAGLLRSIDLEGITARMGYRQPPAAVRRLDDALLAVFGQRYIALHGNEHREAALRARLEKLRS